ncbi:hypothetical protein NPIL_249371, partial [Nephila pilipes]
NTDKLTIECSFAEKKKTGAAGRKRRVGGKGNRNIQLPL